MVRSKLQLYTRQKTYLPAGHHKAPLPALPGRELHKGADTGCQLFNRLLQPIASSHKLMPLQKELTEVFFSVTKLFQAKDANLRRMVYLVIKEVRQRKAHSCKKPSQASQRSKWVRLHRSVLGQTK